LVLRYAGPEYVGDMPASLTLGQRDALLLTLRQWTFGDRIDAYTECPNCRERLEFSTSCRALIVETPLEVSFEKQITVDGIELRLRCPDSRDAAIAANSKDAEEATRALLARCITPTDNSETSVDSLSESARIAAARELAAIDPQAEILLDLSCPACGHSWQGLF